MNAALVPLLGPGKHVAMMNYTDLFFARGVPEKLAAAPAAMKAAIDALAGEPGVLRVFTKAALASAGRRIRTRSCAPRRSATIPSTAAI